MLYPLFNKLRRHYHFALSPQDYEAMRTALRAGFGLESKQAVMAVCVALWAKSKHEQTIIEAEFEKAMPLAEWQIELQPRNVDPITPNVDTPIKAATATAAPLEQPPAIQTHQGNLPPIPPPNIDWSAYQHLILQPQYPINDRQMAQAWRRLRHPIRLGVPTELDIEATLHRYSRLGVATEVVLRPRRRNIARLLLLVDSQGSMMPFQGFVSQLCQVIQQAGRLGEVAIYYFHDVPAEGSDEAVLAPLADELFPTLDKILAEIAPLETGFLYTEAELTQTIPLTDVLADYAHQATVVVISDAGAARQRYDVMRLLDTIAFMKALQHYTPHAVWLNPLPATRWANSTAAQIARHVPMVPLDEWGLYQAVNILRGLPYSVEHGI